MSSEEHEAPEEDVPTEEDYLERDLLDEDYYIYLGEKKKEVEEVEEAEVTKKDSITRRFKRVKTDRVPRHNYYNEDGELVADDSTKF